MQKTGKLNNITIKNVYSSKDTYHYKSEKKGSSQGGRKYSNNMLFLTKDAYLGCIKISSQDS